MSKINHFFRVDYFEKPDSRKGRWMFFMKEETHDKNKALKQYKKYRKEFGARLGRTRLVEVVETTIEEVR